ncbi:MAG TPA: hypothetical protein VGG77_15365, partial [Roseiarcus sp.]
MNQNQADSGIPYDSIRRENALALPGEYCCTDQDGGQNQSNTVEGYYSVFKRVMIGVCQHCGIRTSSKMDQNCKVPERCFPKIPQDLHEDARDVARAL